MRTEHRNYYEFGKNIDSICVLEHTSPNNPNAQLEYIFINKNWINSTLNCEAYATFESQNRLSDDSLELTQKQETNW